MIGPFTKLSVGASSVLGTVFTSEPLFSNGAPRGIMKNKITYIAEISDIKILEATKGCSINFVESFKENKAYRATEFFSKFSSPEERSKIKRRMINVVNMNFGKCKRGVTFNFSHVDSADAFAHTDQVVQ